MKNLFLAILLAIALMWGATEFFGHVGNMHIVHDGIMLSPLENFLSLSFVGVFFTLLGFAVAVSVFGLMAFVFITVFVALVLAGISAFWPVLLAIAVIIWLCRDKSKVSES